MKMKRIGIIIGLSLGFGHTATAAEVVAVVSATNPVGTLSRRQVADIFLGKLTRFPDGRQALPIDQAENSTVREVFYLEFAGKSPAQIKAHWSKIIFTGRGQPPPEVANAIEVMKSLAINPDAIAYIERERVDDRVKIVFSQ
jgi:ABC-type phosphate transport system substrate-binding protein